MSDDSFNWTALWATVLLLIVSMITHLVLENKRIEYRCPGSAAEAAQ